MFILAELTFLFWYALGAIIPEETSTELEEAPTANHVADPTTKPLTVVSQSPQPADFAFRNPMVADMTRASPAFPVSFEEISSSVGVERREDGGTNLVLDPFSAAPFNPATIQQHQAAQQKQQQQLQSTNDFSSIATSSSAPPCNVSSVGPFYLKSRSQFPYRVGGKFIMRIKEIGWLPQCI